MKVVFDTNIYVSRILHGGLPAQVLKISLQAGFTVYASNPILNEVREVLARYGVRAALIKSLLREIRSGTRVVGVEPARAWVASLTPKDNAILGTAVAANAHYLVTGDKKMRAVGRIRSTQIVTAREYLTALVHAGYLVRGDF